MIRILLMASVMTFVKVVVNFLDLAPEIIQTPLHNFFISCMNRPVPLRLSSSTLDSILVSHLLCFSSASLMSFMRISRLVRCIQLPLDNHFKQLLSRKETTSHHRYYQIQKLSAVAKRTLRGERSPFHPEYSSLHRYQYTQQKLLKYRPLSP